MDPDALLSCSLNGTVDELPGFFERFEQWADDAGVGPALASSFGLMLDELLTNVALHGYEGKGGPIEVQIRFQPPTHLHAVLRDQAPAFDPTSVATPVLDAPIEDREIGGLGVHFVRRMAENLSYRRDGAFNEISFSRAVAAVR